MSKRNQAKRQEYSISGLHAPISHYTDAVRFGDLLFISGCGPLDAELKLVGAGDIALQARQTFFNMKLVLDEAGASFADILKLTVYVTEVNDREKFNAVRHEFFGEAKPASTLVEVSALAIPGMEIEIEAVVGLPS